MLEDLAAHVVDIAQNSIAAGAGRIEVTIRKTLSGFTEFEITDDGKGMDEERVKQVLSPFCTSRTTRRVGMGLPFLKQSAELCGGEFKISSVPGKGTRVLASFSLSSIDSPPVGDMAGAFLTLLIDAPSVRWLFKYGIEHGIEEGNSDAGNVGEGNFFELDSEEVAEAVDGLESLSIPDVAMGLKAMIEDGIRAADVTL